MSTNNSTAALSPRRRLLILAICCLSLLLVGMDVTIVNVALPAIRADLHASVSGLQWIIDSYTVVLASLLILSGSTADRLGRRRTFQLGLLLFTAGSLLCGVAPGLGWLVAFRMLQAVGGSMLNPVAMSIITNVFLDPRERARAIGVWAGVVGISLGLGPVLGGVLVESIGWRSIFWVNVPIGIAAFVLAALFVPESKAERARRIDPLGQVLVIVVLLSLTYAIIEAPRASRPGEIWAIGALCALAFVGLLVHESRRTDPLIELTFFRSVPFSAATLMAISAFGAFSAFLFLNTLYLQDVRGLSALHAGLFLLPMAAMTVVLAPLSGAPRRQPRPSVAAADRRGSAAARIAAAHRAERPRRLRLAARLLPRLRRGLRHGQRADHQHSGLGHAAQPGRGCGGSGEHQPAGGSHPRGRDRRRRGEPRRRRRDPHTVLRGHPSGLVDRGRVRRRGAPARRALHRPVGRALGRHGRPPARRAGAADRRECDGGTVSERPEPATSAWQSMRTLVLDLHDRRAAVAEAIGMSYLRAKALRLLLPGPLPMRELCAALVTDPPYISVIVDDLEKRGLVEREVNPADRRSKLVRITSAGRAIARAADQIQSTPPEALAALTDAEVQTLDRLLRRLVEAPGEDRRAR